MFNRISGRRAGPDLTKAPKVLKTRVSFYRMEPGSESGERVIRKISGTCAGDREVCDKIEKLVNMFISGNITVRSCTGRSAIRFRHVADILVSANMFMSEDNPDTVVIIMMMSTGAVISLIYDIHRECYTGVDVAFRVNENTSISHRLIARS